MSLDEWLSAYPRATGSFEVYDMPPRQRRPSSSPNYKTSSASMMVMNPAEVWHLELQIATGKVVITDVEILKGTRRCVPEASM
ncbi:uncharacterized protein PpBr36_09451 [Pyricularia pennisetigena]|uniref:uncharacterized protein n=1 Tax=Pyricularia pennisetigena TaxID=1578925 RepID=UPI00114FCDF1|nr:uncharacterized protein PpBr36_09451 [Pyricularia pennisetigena]TLS21900.1 hypothetical protein PpBr36_09451 [Pyricularia pennisetigena]